MALRSPESFEIHPLALVFPKLPDDDRHALESSICLHGILQPIVLFEGKVIDGVHRLEAMIRLGRKIDTETDCVELDSTDGRPLHEIVWSLNCDRRQLGTSAKAAVYVELFQASKKAEAKARQATSTGGRKPQLVAKLPQGENRKARDEIAKLADVSPRTVQSAMTVKAKDPVLFSDVIAGNVTASAAEKKVLEKEKLKTNPKPKENKPKKKLDDSVAAVLDAWIACDNRKRKSALCAIFQAMTRDEAMSAKWLIEKALIRKK